ncbi:YihY/virulence factor BrkB family protein [Weissella halotolerans]|uniref:YihY/virulence factor BrkB family protein n=1 Tax=Weissella halotolerans TaxID=1615 RepID=UPI0003B51987|nr:YihY/virulence factor BrkB family protein [Weissella halotolerans]
MSHYLRRIFGSRFARVILDYTTRLDLGYASASISYFALLSIFPAVIVLGSFLSIAGVQLTTIVTYLKDTMPPSVSTFLHSVIQSILHQNGVGIFSISIVVTLWSVSRVVAAIRTSQNIIYGVQAKNIAIVDRFISLLWMILIFSLIALLLLFAAIGSNILDALPLDRQIISHIESAKPFIVAGGLFIGLSLFNWLLPAKKPWLPWAIVGTIFEVWMMLNLANLFSWYVFIVARAYSFYQAISSVIVTMLWMNFMSLVSLVGTIITAILDELWPANNHKKLRQRFKHLRDPLK